jgi:hypothetical protein
MCIGARLEFGRPLSPLGDLRSNVGLVSFAPIITLLFVFENQETMTEPIGESPSWTNDEEPISEPYVRGGAAGYTDNPAYSDNIEGHSDNSGEDFHDAEVGDFPPFNNEHSLPTPEEAHSNVSMAGGLQRPTKQRRNFLLLLVGALAMGAIFGFVFGLADGERSSSANSSNSADESSPPETTATPSYVNRYDATVELLYLFSSRTALHAANTPQHLAAKWIADTDTRQVEIPDSTEYEKIYTFLQRYVLAVIYFSLDGDNWTYKQARFLSSASECE